MQDLFIEFLPPWVETGLQPAFYDRESGTVLQQTARMYAKVNELVKAVNGMDKVIKEYVDYIDNYFKNLDVQEEINNKLEAMLESGELVNVIGQFLGISSVLSFDTVSEMASSENLVEGCVVKTLGKTTINDGYGALYKIEALDAQTIDNNIYIAIGDSLVAHKVIEYGTLDPTNPIYYGADPTGTVDSASAINACIQANLGKAIKFTPGKYIVNSAILTPYRTSETVNIDFAGSTLYTNESLPYVLGIGYYNIDYEHMPNGNNYSAKSCYGICENFVIDAPNATVGVMTNQNYWYPRLINFSIFNTLIGVQLGQNKDIRWSSDACLDNGYIQCKSYADRNTRGIVIYGFDNKIVNCRIYNAFIGIEDKKGGNYFINNHIYIYGNANDRETPEFANLYPDTIAFFANGATNDVFESVYFDSYNTAFKYSGDGFVGSFYQCFYGTNAEGYNGNCLDFSEGLIQNLSVRDCTFSCERPAEGGQNYGLKLSSSQAYDILSRGLILENNNCYWLAGDLLTMNTSLNNFKTYRGNYELTANTYYKLGYIPVSAYCNYVIGISGTGSPFKSMARVWIDGDYTIELNNIGTSGTDYGLGVKLVEIRGIKMLEVSFKPIANISANIGLFLAKDYSTNALGLVPLYEPNISDYQPVSTTPDYHSDYEF